MISTSIGNKNFIEVKKISPFVSKVIIKVLYLGLNPNGSFISREFADKLAESLPGSAIVGKYDYFEQDFMDHEERVTFKDGKPVYSFDTRPYGFVDINTKIWYEDFIEEDENHNQVVRTYLCVTGYLWTGIYPECKRVLKGENGQSMQIDKESFKGEWSEEPNKKLRYFIFNDGNISSLCILGEKIKAGFEGANIKPATNFSICEEEKEIILNFSLALMRELKGELPMAEKNNEIQPIEEQLVEQSVKKLEEQNEKEEITTQATVEEKGSESETIVSEEQKEVSLIKLEVQTEEIQKKESQIKETEGQEEVSFDSLYSKENDNKEIEETMNDYHTNADLQSCLDKLAGIAESLSTSVQAILENKSTEQKVEELKSENDKEKEGYILNFSKLSLEKMREVLGNNNQQNNKENHKEMNNTPITSFSAVNQLIVEKEEKKDLPGFMKYVKELEKNQ